MTKPRMTKPLALTLGEPAGIGPDIALEAWLRRRELDLPPFYLLGDRAFLAERAKILRLKVEIAETVSQETRGLASFDEFEAAVAELRQFSEKRRAFLLNYAPPDGDEEAANSGEAK